MRGRDLLYGHGAGSVLQIVHPDEEEQRGDETADDRRDERRECGSQSPSFLNLLPSRRPGAEFDDVPAIYLPPTVLLYKVPGTLVMLDLRG